MRPGESAGQLAERLDELLAPWTGAHSEPSHADGGHGGPSHAGLAEPPGPDTELPSPDTQPRHVLRTAEYTFHAAVADRWRRHRVFLAGDAAHLTPPFIGQGLGSGLRDAANLSWKLAMVLHGTANDHLLDTYQAERRPHATALIRLAAIAGAIMSSPVAARPAPLLRAAGRSARLTDRILAGTSPPLRSGPLAAGRSPVGALVPQFATETGERFDDLLGPGFTLLVQHDAGTADQAKADRTAPDRIVALAARLRARTLVSHGHHNVHHWLVSHDLDAVLIRPDRVILAVRRSRRAAARNPGVT
nr:FAD-dependent monooxygenase [Kineosporia babensis]